MTPVDADWLNVESNSEDLQNYLNRYLGIGSDGRPMYTGQYDTEALISIAVVDPDSILALVVLPIQVGAPFVVYRTFHEPFFERSQAGV